MPRGIPEKKKPKKTGPKKEIKLNDVTIKKLEEAFSIDCTVQDACFYAGISIQTYYNWIKRHEELKKRFEELQARPVLLARQTVVKRIPESYGNAMDYLERKRPDEYSKTKKVDVQVTDLSKKADDLLIEFDDET